MSSQEIEEAPLPTVAGRYDDRVARGDLRYDPAQHAIAMRMDALIEDISNVDLAVKSSALGWLFSRRQQKPRTIRGLYIWGGVGRGKTMLMDLLHELAPCRLKRRVHFHAFMAETQDRIHKARQQILAGTLKSDDPIAPVADIIANEAHLLCFDEFVVTDIADAMILGRLFTRLFERGVVVVATSNRPPRDLYLGGLNRQLFLPFIDLLGERLDVMELASLTDYRSTKHDLGETWLAPLGPQTTAALDAAWTKLCDGEQPVHAFIPFRGRRISVPRSAGGAARFSFADLCEAPLAAADYLAIAGAYHTIVIEGIPVLGEGRRNEARRFIHLIDALYDRGIRLVASAEAQPDELYLATEGTEVFEFARTASRLGEMRSAEYLAARQAASA